MDNDCHEHDWPDGRLLTREDTPRCPFCRQALGIKLGARPRRRRASIRPAPPAATVSARDLAAGERPDEPEQLALDLEDGHDEPARQLHSKRPHSLDH